MPQTAVVVLAAGKGTRMHSDPPKAKVLHEVGGLSLLEHSLRSAALARPDRLVLVVGHAADEVRLAAEAIEADLKRQIIVVKQAEPRGSGDALRCAVEARVLEPPGTYLAVSGDMPLLGPDTIRKLWDEHRSSDVVATVLTAEMSDPTDYGRIVRDDTGAIAAIVEECDATQAERLIGEVNAGTYAFDAAFLESALPDLTDDNRQGEFYLTGVVEIAHRRGLDVQGLRCTDPWQVFGVNDLHQLALAEAELSRRRDQEKKR